MRGIRYSMIWDGPYQIVNGFDSDYIQDEVGYDENGPSIPMTIRAGFGVQSLEEVYDCFIPFEAQDTEYLKSYPDYCDSEFVQSWKEILRGNEKRWKLVAVEVMPGNIRLTFDGHGDCYRQTLVIGNALRNRSFTILFEVPTPDGATSKTEVKLAWPGHVTTTIKEYHQGGLKEYSLQWGTKDPPDALYPQIVAYVTECTW